MLMWSKSPLYDDDDKGPLDITPHRHKDFTFVDLGVNVAAAAADAVLCGGEGLWRGHHPGLVCLR